jgi:hypothetical protein
VLVLSIVIEVVEEVAMKEEDIVAGITAVSEIEVIMVVLVAILAMELLVDITVVDIMEEDIFLAIIAYLVEDTF